ncbi:MAG: ribose-phosphate diphosphokinase [Thermoplasmataceae archaeon]
MIIVAGSTSRRLAAEISERTHSQVADVERRRFPDGELYLRIKKDLKDQEVMMISSTTNDESLIETMLLIDAAREFRPRSILAIIPYFGYARQHMRYNEGEPVSSKVWTYLLERFADKIISIDIHDEQTLSYSSKPFLNISIMDSIASHYRDRAIDYVVSPDDGGSRRSLEVAQRLSAESFYLDKKRIDSSTVEMKFPDIDIKGKNILVVDDVISTGGTILKAVKLIRERGAARVYVSAVHGLFVGESQKKIEDIADDLAVTETVETRSSKISIAKEILDKIGVKSA